MTHSIPLAKAYSVLNGNRPNPRISNLPTGIPRLNQPFNSRSVEWAETLRKLLSSDLKEGVFIQIRFIIAPNTVPTPETRGCDYDVKCTECYEETVRAIDELIQRSENFVSVEECDDVPRRIALQFLKPGEINPELFRCRQFRAYLFSHASKSLERFHEILIDPPIKRCPNHEDKATKLTASTHICKMEVKFADFAFSVEFYK